MFGHGNHIFGTGSLEQFHPFVGIELLGLEHGDEVLVAELGVGTVGFDVVLVFVGALLVHKTRVPFASICRNGIGAPVDKDTEFGVGKPLREFIVGGNAVPVVLEYTSTLRRGNGQKVRIFLACGLARCQCGKCGQQ